MLIGCRRGACQSTPRTRARCRQTTPLHCSTTARYDPLPASPRRDETAEIKLLWHSRSLLPCDAAGAPYPDVQLESRFWSARHVQARGPAARGARRERRPGRGKGDNGVGGQTGQRWTNFVTKEALCFNRRRTEDSGWQICSRSVCNSTCRSRKHWATFLWGSRRGITDRLKMQFYVYGRPVLRFSSSSLLLLVSNVSNILLYLHLALTNASSASQRRQASCTHALCWLNTRFVQQCKWNIKHC